MFGPGFPKFVGPEKSPIVLDVIRHPFAFWTLTISSLCDPSVASSRAVDWRHNAVNGAEVDLLTARPAYVQSFRSSARFLQRRHGWRRAYWNGKQSISCPAKR